MKKLIAIGLCVLSVLTANAQFYNGLQQDFGKNRIQYNEKFWFFFRHDMYDVYFDKNGRTIAEFVTQHADSAYQTLKKRLDFEYFDYSRRVVFVVYNTLSDFRQSNIGYSSSESDYNVGGTTQIIDNKVSLYFSGDHNDLLRQIRHGLAEVMLNEFLYGTGKYRRILSNSDLATYPTWFFDGITTYFSNEWTIDKEEQFISYIQKHHIHNPAQYPDEQSICIGHALWNFIAEKYGEKKISDILYFSKISDNIDESFIFNTGKSLQLNLDEMSMFYMQRQRSNSSQGRELTIPRKLTKRLITDITFNEKEDLVSFVTNKKGKTNIWLYNTNTKTTEKIFRNGEMLEQVIDCSHPVSGWNPFGTALAYFYEKKGKVWLAWYNPQDNSTVTREFHHFEKVLDFSYAKDGMRIVFSGVQGGQTDIFIYNIQTFAIEQITNDRADDRHPRFVNNDSGIIFSSNRTNTRIDDYYAPTGNNYNIFLSTNGSLQRITENTYNKTKPYELSPGRYIYLSDSETTPKFTGIFNDSTIAYIDTAIHYTYIARNYETTAERGSIKDFAIDNNTIVFLQNKNGNSILKIDELTDQEFKFVGQTTSENEEGNLNNDSLSTSLNTMSYHRENANLYKTNFYVNKLVNQIDFSFVNTGYQNFTGGKYDYSQNVNVLLKLGIIDLFEDYRLTGAYRFTGSLGKNEYLISIENLKKRIDRQYVFHRQSGMTYGDNNSRYFTRIQDNNFICRYTYPFCQTQSISINPNFRYLKNITLATDMNSLQEPDVNEFWTGVSCNYVFDNVLKKAENILFGTRAKVFAEGFLQINESDSYLGVVGFDVRHYQQIYRTIIFASRIAYSTSFGSAPLLYYLGAVDNWLNSTYNDIEYDQSVNWAYQAIGTNMRGFGQNIRNGNAFAVINAEIRVPVFQTFMNKPIKSDIVKNFQVVGFADFGGAWRGIYPGQKENAYNYTIIDQEPFYIKVDEMRQPFVVGYGIGLRTRLFGYFIRLDFARGYDEGVTSRVRHISIGHDF